jgi:hypothetical protein
MGEWIPPERAAIRTLAAASPEIRAQAFGETGESAAGFGESSEPRTTGQPTAAEASSPVNGDIPRPGEGDPDVDAALAFRGGLPAAAEIADAAPATAPRPERPCCAKVRRCPDCLTALAGRWSPQCWPDGRVGCRPAAQPKPGSREGAR